MDYLYLALSIGLLISASFNRNRQGFIYVGALCVWISSEISTQFFASSWASLGYVLFYPLVFVAIPTLFEIESSGEIIRLLDGAVLVLGSSCIISAIMLRHFKANFLLVLYPNCDLIILVAVLVAFVRRPICGRSLLVLSGFLIYSITDFIYLIQVNQNKYEFNSNINYGWLLAFLFINIGLHRRGIKSEKFPPIPIFYLTISVVGSSAILAAIALSYYEIPNYLGGPALATLITAFARMAFALKQSEKLAASEVLAKIDDLTGLPNRRRFLGEIEKYQNGTILLMDLDGFKPVNDNFGHETGDEILKQVSARFLKAIPQNSLLARLGGDEFAVLTEGSYEMAMELALALRATLSYPFNVKGEQIRVDVSIGCVVNDGKSDLMSRADTAMYQAKKAQVGVWAGGT